MKRKIFLLSNIIVPILIGCTFYLFFAPNVLIAQQIRTFIGMKVIALKSSGIVSFLFSFLCDFLWAYALTFTVYYWAECFNEPKVLSIIIPILFAITLEFSQKIGISKGTFDLFDIVCELCAITIAQIIINHWRLKCKKY